MLLFSLDFPALSPALFHILFSVTFTSVCVCACLVFVVVAVVRVFVFIFVVVCVFVNGGHGELVGIGITTNIQQEITAVLPFLNKAVAVVSVRPAGNKRTPLVY